MISFVDDYGNQVFKFGRFTTACWIWSRDEWLPLTETWVSPHVIFGNLSFEDALYISSGASYKILETDADFHRLCYEHSTHEHQYF